MTTTTAKPANDRDDAILAIRKALKARSGKAWSVTGGRGTAWGWMRISSPPARCNEFGQMTDADRAELSSLLGVTTHADGVSVAASTAHRREYLERAEGKTPSVIAEAYWD